MLQDLEQDVLKGMESGKLYIREKVNTKVDKYAITLGDFQKNAGIVGFKYMLDVAEAKEEIDFGISDDAQSLWISEDFAKTADWTDMYFKACVKYFGPFTAYQGVLDKIQICLEKIENNNWKPGKEEKEDLKFINDKLLSNSYQNGFETIKESIESAEVYLNLKKNKLNSKLEQYELKQRLIELKEFLIQSKCRETFIMKSAIYAYIKCFWSGKSFLYKGNAKKDMRLVFEKDFSDPFREYLESNHKNTKEICVDCGAPIYGKKEKIPITFVNETGDDFGNNRKRSAFWECKVDAFLCPICSFVYALSPLGFRLFTDKFIFVNINSNVRLLLASNKKVGKSVMEGEKKENQKYSQWFAQTINILLKEKMQELTNIQIIIRGVNAEEEKYIFYKPPRSTLKIISKPEVARAIEWLGKVPKAEVGNEVINIHENVIMNLFYQHNQYLLLNSLMRNVIDDQKLNLYIYWIFKIQLWSELIFEKDREKRKGNIMDCKILTRCGSELRKAIMESKGDTTGESLRGINYQLLTALSVNNVGKFMDIVLRLYGVYGTEKDENEKSLLIPKALIEILNDKEKAQIYGHAFVAGLVGCYEAGKEN